MDRWSDTESGRDVWVVELDDAANWPTKTPWSCAAFGLLVALERVVDAAPLAEKARDQGLAVACAWGPGCAIVEDAFDDVIGDKTAITMSHPHESLEEALEDFLAVVPARAGCDAWCIAAFGPKVHDAVTRAMKRRRAKPRR